MQYSTEAVTSAPKPSNWGQIEVAQICFLIYHKVLSIFKLFNELDFLGDSSDLLSSNFLILIYVPKNPSGNTPNVFATTRKRYIPSITREAAII